jgi:hypothetical protein
MLNKVLPMAAVILLFPALLPADNSLLYLEMQGVAGYSRQDSKTVYYSHMADEVMQKPSAGFDYIRRFSSESGDWGMAAVQGRIAYDENTTDKYQLQLYNAYVKRKFTGFDLWAGHNRPAFGLSSYLDSHGLLLQPLSMEGFGFDRDWGAGLYEVLDAGDIALSATTGSGMPLRADGNYLVSARGSRGVLEKDNYTFGVSASYGKALETMGYKVINAEPVKYGLLALDFTYLFDNYELRAEACAGERDNRDIYGVLLRLGAGLLDENRLKLELQPVLTDMGTGESSTNLYSGLSYILSDSLTVRSMYSSNSRTLTGQLYWYYKV